jgi:hypothetical protein
MCLVFASVAFPDMTARVANKYGFLQRGICNPESIKQRGFDQWPAKDA